MVTLRWTPIADTTILGSNCVILSYTGKECEVSPYSSDYKSVCNVPVVTSTTVWTNAMDGTSYLLILHEALWMGDQLDHTLINPNQLSVYGVEVQDNPYSKEWLSIITNETIIPLYTQGTVICGETFTPTDSKSNNLPWLVLTSPHDWDPQKITFPPCGFLPELGSEVNIMAVDTLLQYTVYDPFMIASLMSSQVQVSEAQTTRQDFPSEIPSSASTATQWTLCPISVRGGTLGWGKLYKHSK